MFFFGTFQDSPNLRFRGAKRLQNGASLSVELHSIGWIVGNIHGVELLQPL